jgi:hypothetical protein
VNQTKATQNLAHTQTATSTVIFPHSLELPILLIFLSSNHHALQPSTAHKGRAGTVNVFTRNAVVTPSHNTPGKSARRGRKEFCCTSPTACSFIIPFY